MAQNGAYAQTHPGGGRDAQRRQKACCVRADGSAFEADPLFVEKRIRLASPPGDSVRISHRKHVLATVIGCSICVHLQ